MVSMEMKPLTGVATCQIQVEQLQKQSAGKVVFDQFFIGGHHRV